MNKKRPRYDQELTNTCATCRYCQKAKERDLWGCWICTNVGSSYYQALLNTDLNGNASKKVTWAGCKKWKLEKDHREVSRKADAEVYETYSQRLEQELKEVGK